MKYLLQQYDNGKWGYKGIDDCSNKNMSNNKGIGEDCKVVNEQQENEDREAFFIRINAKPNEKEYGNDEKLDLQVNDEDWEIRADIAEQGYGLNKLVNDSDELVRAEVAKQGYGLDELINDKDWPVRCAVAEQGYGLDKLVNDESDIVRKAVLKKGYGLEKLVNDKNEWIRSEVAEQGYGLDKLVNDRNKLVRVAVARQGYGLEILINDENNLVRAEVAKQGYGLDKLINDEDEWVRSKVAEQGFGLDKLINDKNPGVRIDVIKYIKRNNISLNDLIVINEDFSNKNFYNFLVVDYWNIFFAKYFEQFVKEKLPQMKKDEWFNKVVELCDYYNNKEFKNKEIRNILDEYWGF